MAKEELSVCLTAQQVNELRCDGNVSFAEGKYSTAAASYSSCIAECLKSLHLSPPVNGLGSEAWKELAEKFAATITTTDSSGNGSGSGSGNGNGTGDDESNIKIFNILLRAWSNRAEAFLRLRKFKRALADAEMVLALEPHDLKSLNRRGKALEELHLYEKANSCFLAAFKLSPHDPDIRDALTRTKICSQQSLHGNYDLSKFYLNRCKGSFLPCCDYVGPVEIRHFLAPSDGAGAGGGRALFLTRDVAAGELLLVSNAVAIAPILPAPAVSPKGFLQFENRHQEAEHLVTKLSQVARSCPRSRRQLLSLPYADTEKQHMAIPPMDLFKTGRGGEVEEEEEGEEGEVMDGEEDSELDLRRISGIARFSSYNLHSHTADISDNYSTRGGGGAAVKRTGVWPLPSFLHHSCFPNCLRMHVGNAMFVRAAMPMLAGEVLTIAWFDVADPLRARQASCRNWGFVCRCDRCIFEESVEPLERMGQRFFDLLRLSPDQWTDGLSALVPGVEEIIRSASFGTSGDGDGDGEGGAVLGFQQRSWIRASCLYAYIARAEQLKDDLERRIPCLEVIVESVTAVAIASLCALEYSAALLRDVERHFGKGSDMYVRTEKSVLEVFRIAYGTQNRAALLALVQNFFDCSEVVGARRQRPRPRRRGS